MKAQNINAAVGSSVSCGIDGAAGAKSRDMDGESGMMVVEAVISFTAFIMVCLVITFLINIFMLHNRVQFALNSAAHEIAAYSYVYDALGLRDAEGTLASDGEEYTQPIDDTTAQVMDTLNQLQGAFDEFKSTGETVSDIELSADYYNNVKSKLDSLSGSVSDTVDSGKQSISDVKNLFSDGNSLIVGIIYMAESKVADSVKRLIGQGAAWAMTKKYLDEPSRGADAYLRAYGVVDGYDGLDFSGSSLFCDEDMRMIDLVVEYDVDLSFANFVLPFTTVHIVQRVSVGGWVGGDGIKVEV